MNHTIIVENPKNNATFQNSLIVCYGRIEDKSKHCTPQKYLLIKHQDKSCKVDIDLQVNRFRCIIELGLGINSIIFTYCCTSIALEVEFNERLSNFQVQPIYIICKDDDGCFQAPDCEPNYPQSACKRITLGCKLFQTVFALNLKSQKTFVLNKRGCLIFYSKLTRAEVFQMNKLDLWQSLAREIMTSEIGSVTMKYIGILSCTRFKGNLVENLSYDELVALTDGYIAYGGAAFALLGSACLYTWPESLLEVEQTFRNEMPVNRREFLDDSCYRGTLGGCYATSLGAALHELCHTFDLGHDIGIMGRGFNNIQQLFINHNSYKLTNKLDAYWPKHQLMLLNYHRWFNDYPEYSKRHILFFDSTMKLVKSTAGICVIELREGSEEMVIASWVFDNIVQKFSHQVSYNVDTKSDILVVVEDNCGNVLKQSF